MADDDTGESGGNPAAEAAAEAAQAVVEQHAAVEANANSAIAAAQAETDRANEEARRIASAAINTELGAQIQSTRQEFTTWQTQAQEREAAIQTRLEATAAELGNVKAALGTLLGALNQANPSPSTPPTSETPDPEAPTPAPANPAESGSAGGPPGQASPPQHSSRKGKRLL